MILDPKYLKDFVWKDIGDNWNFIFPSLSKSIFSPFEKRFSSALVKDNQVKCLGLPSYLLQNKEKLLYRSVLEDRVNFRTFSSPGTLFGDKVSNLLVPILYDPNFFYDH